MESVFKQKYRGRDGKTRESKNYYFDFKDHTGTVRRMAGYVDKGLTKELKRKVKRLASHRALNQSLDAELVSWLEGIPAKLRSNLSKWGLLDSRAEGQSKPLSIHLDDFRQALIDKGNT